MARHRAIKKPRRAHVICASVSAAIRLQSFRVEMTPGGRTRLRVTRQRGRVSLPLERCHLTTFFREKQRVGPLRNSTDSIRP